jgi:hypothetical protein
MDEMTPGEMERSARAELRAIERCEQIIAPLRERLVLAETIVETVLDHVEWRMSPKLRVAMEQWLEKFPR